jgi:hypothetical protein
VVERPSELRSLLISRITDINAVYIGYKGQVLSMNVKALLLIYVYLSNMTLVITSQVVNDSTRLLGNIN